MSLGQLREQWTKRYGAAPRHRSAELLRHILAWRIQCDRDRRGTAALKQLLERKGSSPAPQPTVGMRLAREWEGQRHEVMVTSEGILYHDQIYKSLSEVARHITGKRWNGPRFFGLRQENIR